MSGHLSDVARYRRIEAMVYEALDNGAEGGYHELLTNSPFAVAVDLATYAADLEDIDPEYMVPMVRNWQTKNNNPG